MSLKEHEHYFSYNIDSKKETTSTTLLGGNSRSEYWTFPYNCHTHLARKESRVTSKHQKSDIDSTLRTEN